MLSELIKNIFSRSAAWKGPSLKGKTILIIDDGEIERKMYSAFIEKAGGLPKTAENGAAGLATARSRKFDVILLDYSLPDMNGVAVCRQLKMDPSTKNMPVIFLTGSVKPEGVITCYDAGAECYLSKPVSAETLITQIQSALPPEVA